MKTIICQLMTDAGVIKSAFGIIMSDYQTNLFGYPINRHSSGSIIGSSTNFRLALKR